MPVLGLYIHIPFCSSRCDYCDFFVVVGGDDPAGFFDSLSLDLQTAVRKMEKTPFHVDTVFFGGETPSFVDEGLIAGFLKRCRGLLDITPGAEITIEANPDGVTEKKASAWREAGVNRLSLGVQSFNDEVLKPRGRNYSGAEAVAAFELARKAAFPGMSIDLIAGLPGESVQSFLDGVGRGADLEPDHMSVYLLETGDSLKASALARAIDIGRLAGPDEDDLIRMYSGTTDHLNARGYKHYEISNFCRPGAESRHNLKYWNSNPWLGIGPSANAFVGGRRTAWPAGLSEWRHRLEEEIQPDDVTLDSVEEQAKEALILQLRLLDGVDLDGFARRWSYSPRESLGAELDELEAEGLLETNHGRLGLTRRGILLSNEVFGRFF